MKNPGKAGRSSVPESAYTREYFEEHAHGHEEFAQSQGHVLPARLDIPLSLGNVGPGMRVVDLGCGRGELVLHCARRGARVWGVDYSQAAVQIANQNLSCVATREHRAQLLVLQGDALHLPLEVGSVDLVLMVDIVEHLLPEELADSLTEVWRILRPGGRLVVHTMPNLWYYRFGYPLYRLIQRLRGRELPANPRDRWGYKHVHVNEQNPRRMLRTLAHHKFRARVWVQSTQSYDSETHALLRWGMRVAVQAFLLRWIFCNDIFAMAVKPETES